MQGAFHASRNTREGGNSQTSPAAHCGLKLSGQSQQKFNRTSPEGSPSLWEAWHSLMTHKLSLWAELLANRKNGFPHVGQSAERQAKLRHPQNVLSTKFGLPDPPERGGEKWSFEDFLKNLYSFLTFENHENHETEWWLVLKTHPLFKYGQFQFFQKTTTMTRTTRWKCLKTSLDQNPPSFQALTALTSVRSHHFDFFVQFSTVWTEFCLSGRSWECAKGWWRGHAEKRLSKHIRWTTAFLNQFKDNPSRSQS